MGKYAMAAAAVLAVVGCGGGGGDDGGSSAPPAAATPLALTASNYVQATQDVLSNTAYLSDLGTLVTGAKVASEGAVVRIAISQALVARERFRSARELVAGVTTTESIPCDGGGSITATMDDLNGNQDADSGDSLRLSIASCNLFGHTANGALAINFTSVSGSIGVGSYSASVAVTVDNLVVTSAAGRSAGSGQINLALSGNGTNTSSITLTVPSFTLSSTYGSVVSSGSLSNFSIATNTTSAGLGSSTSTTVSGVVASTGLDSRSISISTVTPFVGSTGAPNPSSGQLIVTGAGGSQLRITALNSTTVLIELDADGNGTFETSTTRPWNQFIG